MTQASVAQRYPGATLTAGNPACRYAHAGYLLHLTGRRYIIGAPKSELKTFGTELAAANGWRTVHEDVEVKLARHPETDETVILCRSNLSDGADFAPRYHIRALVLPRGEWIIGSP